MKRLVNRFRRQPVEVLKDLVTAHWKAIIAGVTVIVIQEVDNETIDWAAGILGTLLTGGKANNEAARKRIYRKR